MDHALDALDRRLLALLRADARLPTATLARQLHVSRGTVQNRMARLVLRDLRSIDGVANSESNLLLTAHR
ncbi:AsnC/Lrp family transcriptional regulator [Bordetella pertussis]|nr:AsnC/Lrp family transcriptional regulator [Bordetella pertussis]